MSKSSPPITPFFQATPSLCAPVENASCRPVPAPPPIPSFTLSPPLQQRCFCRVKPRARLGQLPSGLLAAPSGAVCNHLTLKKFSLEYLMELIGDVARAITGDAKAWMYQGVFRVPGCEERKNDCIARLVKAKDPGGLMSDLIDRGYASDAAPILKTLLLAFRDKATEAPALTNPAKLLQAEAERSKIVAEILSEQAPDTFEALSDLARVILENSSITRGAEALEAACPIMHEVQKLKNELERERKENRRLLQKDSSFALENFMGQAWRSHQIRKMTEPV